MTILFDIIALLFSIGGAFFAVKIFLLVKSRYFIPIILALIYTSILRLLVLIIDFNFDIFGLTKSSLMTMFVLFYVLNFAGITGIYYGFKDFIKNEKI